MRKLSTLLDVPPLDGSTVDKSPTVNEPHTRRRADADGRGSTVDDEHENVFDTFPEIDESELYDDYISLDRMIVNISQHGLSKDLAAGMDLHGELHTLLPELSVDTLPLIGDPTDTCSVLALESLGSIARGFWTWVKKMCIALLDVIKGILKLFGDTSKTMRKRILDNAKKLSGRKIDPQVLKSAKVDMVPFKVHDFIVGSVPDLESEWINVGSRVIALDKKKYLSWYDRYDDDTMDVAVTLGKAAKNNVFGDKEYKAAKKVPGILKKMKDAISSDYGKFTIFTGRALDTWIKLGCQVSPIFFGVHDMTKFNEHEMFKPKPITFYEGGWDINRAKDTKKTLHALDVVDSMKGFLSVIQAEMDGLVIMSNKLNNKNSTPELRENIRDRISGLASIQKLTNGLSKAIFKSCKNLIDIQDKLIELTD